MCKCLQAGISRSVIGVSHNKGILVKNTQTGNDLLDFATLAVVNRFFLSSPHSPNLVVYTWEITKGRSRG